MSLKNSQIREYGGNPYKTPHKNNKKVKKESHKKIRRLIKNLEYIPVLNRYINGWYN